MVDFENLERSSVIALHAIAHSHSINFEQPEILSMNWYIYRERIAAEQWYINNEKVTNNNKIQRSQTFFMFYVNGKAACNTKKKSLHPAWNLL